MENIYFGIIAIEKNPNSSFLRQHLPIDVDFDCAVLFDGIDIELKSLACYD